VTAAFPRAFLVLAIRLFADDCFLYHAITGRMETQILQDGLNALSKWEKDSQMSFNIEECLTICISTNKNVVTPYILNGHTMDRDHHHI